MKSRLSASISLLNLGGNRFTNAFSSSLNFVLFYGRYRGVSRCQYRGLQTLRTVGYSSDDDFADLGPPSKGLDTQFKLRTQKPEANVKNGPNTKGSSWSSSHGPPQSNFSIFRNFFDKQTSDKPSQTSDKPSQPSKSIVKGCDNLSGRYVDTKKPSNLYNSCSVMAEDVTDGVDYCDSDFETVTVRIQGIAKETPDHIVHSICKSIGALEGLAKVNDAVDVLFRVKNAAKSQYILKRLNNTLVDDSQWSAFECPKISTSSSSSEDARNKIGLQINSSLNDMKQRFEHKKVCFEDLLTLHMAVMHLEGLPTTLELPNKH